MKITQLLEALFERSHCESQFAYFCLLVLYIFLAYSFAQGVLDELRLKEDGERSRVSQGQTNRKSLSRQLSASGKDYSALQNEQMLKQDLFEKLVQEHRTMEGYQYLDERRSLNANCFVKNETQVRIDAILEVSSKALYDLVQDFEKIPSWYKTDQVKCLSNKQIDTLKSGSEVYLMTLQT